MNLIHMATKITTTFLIVDDDGNVDQIKNGTAMVKKLTKDEFVKAFEEIKADQLKLEEEIDATSNQSN